MRAAIDIDGVLADFCYSFTKVAAGLGLSDGAWPTALQRNWKYDFHVDPVWREIDACMNWWMTLNPLVTREELGKLSRWERHGHAFWFVSNRHDKGMKQGFGALRQTELWLESLGIENPSVVLVNNKARWCVENKINVALEDKPENIALLQAMDIKTVTRSWQYNEGSEPRVDSLMQFLEEHF